jgi:hypothetical protein
VDDLSFAFKMAGLEIEEDEVAEMISQYHFVDNKINFE